MVFKLSLSDIMYVTLWIRNISSMKCKQIDICWLDRRVDRLPLYVLDPRPHEGPSSWDQKRLSVAATRHHHGLVRAAGLEAPGHPRLSSPFAWGRRPVWRCGSSGEERPSEDGGEINSEAGLASSPTRLAGGGNIRLESLWRWVSHNTGNSPRQTTNTPLMTY